MGTKSEYDYAIVRTWPMENTTTETGTKVGMLSIKTVNPTSSALNWALSIRGYPKDASPQVQEQRPGSQDLHDRIFEYLASSLEGLSGAAVLDGSNVVFGVHVGEGPDTNYGKLITSTARTDITSWVDFTL